MVLDVGNGGSGEENHGQDTDSWACLLFKGLVNW